MKKVILFALAVLSVMLTGCASVNQALSAYESAAVAGVQGADDNYIKGWSNSACATPFGATVRHPEIVPALKDLCVPSGTSGSAVNLLNAIPPATAKPAPTPVPDAAPATK
ncbi:MAG: hypothetical protein JO142_02330 [Burkholderiales bacterium]|nr:hypothetical protein [Burkholderiales bacterium]